MEVASLPIIQGPEQDVASAFLGPAPDLAPSNPGPGANIFQASQNARMIAGNVLTTFTGPVERIDIHVADTLINSLGLSAAVAPVLDIHEQVTDVLRNNYEDISQAILYDPYKDTCSWILTHTTYLKWWVDNAAEFLWLCGPPGSGKTTLSLYLLHFWRATRVGSHNIAYFFFSRQIDKASSPTDFLSALLNQILELYPITHTLLKDLPGLKALPSVASLTGSYEGLWTVLNQILTALHSLSAAQPQKPLLCIIDALEECVDTPTTQFLRRLNKDLKASQFPMKVLVSCRQDHFERSRQMLAPTWIVNVAEENLVDIHGYVEGNLQQWSQSPSDEDNINKLKLTITARAEGIFLWAALVLEGLLQRGSSVQAVLDTVNSFPKGRDEKLKHLYEEILKQASRNLEDKFVIADIKSILGVITMSATPLTLKELAECLEIENPDGRHMNLEHDVRTTCRGLLRIEGAYVKPFHLTLKSYLEDPEECLPEFHIDNHAGHARLAEICLKYAADRLSLAFSEDLEEIQAILSEHEFLTYAANQWPYHVKYSGNHWQSLVELIQTLLGEMTEFRKWYSIIVRSETPLRQQLNLFRMSSGHTTEIAEFKLGPAHLLSLIGFLKPLFVALFESSDLETFSVDALGPNNKDSHGRVPAHWAASYSFLSTAYDQDQAMKVLLTNKVSKPKEPDDVDALSHILQMFPESSRVCDDAGKTPLHIACAGGDTRKVKLVLESKTDLDAQDKLGYTSLHHSCGPMGYENAKLLLSHKAKVDIDGQDANTPLHIAASHGQEQTVKLLIDKKANLYAKNKLGMTPLHYAVMFGKNYSKLLMGQMVQNNILKSDESDPLGFLSSYFNSFAARERTVRRLIAAGADLETTTIFGETPLFHAAFGGHLQSLKILLSAKANINATNRYGWTPLYAAAFMGQDIIAQILIQAQADSSLRDFEGNSPLHIAAQLGHRELVTCLIRAGADLRATNKSGFRPLHMATMTNIEFLKKMSMAHENLVPGSTPYLAALKERDPDTVLKAHVDIVEDLLEAGAEMDAVGNAGESPLHVAATHGHDPVVRLLIDKGADVNASNSQGGKPIHAAALIGNDECLKTLIEYGADAITSVTRDGFGPLLIASFAAHESTIRILINSGAQVKCDPPHETCPIHGLIEFDESEYQTSLKMTQNEQGHPQLDANRASLFMAQRDRGWDAMLKDQENCLRLLLGNGANVDCVPENGKTALCLAAIGGRTSLASILLQHHANVEFRDAQGRTPIFMAVQGGFFEMVALLLVHNASVLATNPDGWTPLVLAVLFDHGEIAKLLIQHGADPNVVIKDGVNVLHLASEIGMTDVVQLLLDKEADVNAITEDQENALHFAAQKGNAEVIKILIHYGADMNFNSNSDRSAPLHATASNGHLEAVREFLESKAEIDIVDSDGWTPLHLAVNNSHMEVVKQLHEGGADIYRRTNGGSTSLHLAAGRSHTEIVRYLIDHGLDVNATNEEMRTPLHSAADAGHTLVVSVLLEKEADMSAIANGGWSPLHLAVGKNRLEVVQVLIAKGASLSVTTDHGFGLLHSAASGGFEEIVKELLEKGADVSTRSANGSTALHSAATTGNVTIVNDLIARGVSLSATIDLGMTALQLAARDGKEAMVKVLIEKGADHSTTNDNGTTALHLAVQNGHIGVVEELLRNGANPNTSTNLHWTPIHTAANESAIALTILLIDAGVNLDARGPQGNTPLLFVARTGNLEMMKLLVAHKASLSLTDDNGISALHFAANQGHLEMCKWLLDQGADVNMVYNNGNTALREAVALQRHEVVQFLLDAKADPSIKTTDGLILQYSAVVANDVEGLKLLEMNGLLLDEVSDGGHALLHTAAALTDCQVLKFLLHERNQNPDVQNELGFTPLHQAVYSYNLPAVEILVQAGADPTRLDGYGRSSLDWTRSYPAIFDILSRKAPDHSPTSEEISQREIVSLLQYLIPKVENGRQALYHNIGHCLMFLGNEEDACFAFEQQIYDGQDAMTTSHNVSCNICTENIVKCRRYVCRDCPDIDLCEPCIDKYKAESNEKEEPNDEAQINEKGGPNEKEESNDKMNIKENEETNKEEINDKVESNEKEASNDKEESDEKGKSLLPTCQKHRFLQIPRPSWRPSWKPSEIAGEEGVTHSSDSEVSRLSLYLSSPLPTPTQQLWLNSLREKYLAPAIVEN